VTGVVIVLNGTGSAGKSSIVAALQQVSSDPYVNVGIDTFWIHMFPWAWDGARIAGVKVTPVEGSKPPKCAWDVQPYGHLFISGLHHTVVTLAALGHHLIVDHAFDHRRWVEECVRLWQDIPVYLIGVYCPLDVLLQRAEARKAERPEAYPQIVTWEFDETHRYTRGIYDLEVDTSRLSPMECARQILRHVEGTSPRAFAQLAEVGMP
jgi:chloramphenicol 3-O phosphotransferase